MSPASRVLAVGVREYGQVILQTLDNEKLDTITVVSGPKVRAGLPGVTFSADSRRMAVSYSYSQGENGGAGVKFFDVSTLGKKKK